MNAMKYHLTAAQNKVVQVKVAEEIDKQMRSYLINYDALWLWSLARSLGFGKKRLEQVYKAFYEQRREDKAWYECEDGYEGLLENEAVKGLKNIGVDIIALAEASEPVVRTHITEGRK